MEVLSPNTRDFDTFKKLVEPNEPVTFVWRRDGAHGRVEARARGLEAEIDMLEIGVTLKMAAIYEGVEFPVRPRLVSTED